MKGTYDEQGEAYIAMGVFEFDGTFAGVQRGTDNGSATV